ncbi:hypothetical protein DFH06DRAFT_9798 [Mycena polygramma]|nr:hypothetical protein DFH06DRAFT_9798 [Mycena polygramma]
MSSINDTPNMHPRTIDNAPLPESIDNGTRGREFALGQLDMPLGPSIERLIQLLVESAYHAARSISAQPCNSLLTPDDSDALDDIYVHVIDCLVVGKFGQLLNQAITTQDERNQRRDVETTEDILSAQRERIQRKRTAELYDGYIKQQKEKLQRRIQALVERRSAAAPRDVPDGRFLAPPLLEEFRPAQAPPSANSKKIEARVRAVSSKVAEIHELFRELEHTFDLEIDSEDAAMDPNDLQALLRALAAADMKRPPEKESDAVRAARENLKRLREQRNAQG